MSASPPLLRFVQLLLDGPRDGTFILKDLPGSGKRIDLLCRNLAACFEWGPETWPEGQMELIALLPEDVALFFRIPDGDLPVGERAWAEEIRAVLEGGSSEFLERESIGLKDLLMAIRRQRNSKVWVLEEGGADLRSIKDLDATSQNSFILGDHQGFDKDALQTLDEFDITPVSVGPRSYLSSHCIAAVISEMERIRNR
ncbi:hypothetical protein EU545_01305 [Candidatus Thorarchaeota archaeon]|nr:MAG: hypothetical protein EU545_01305 [Candidatus Thorarchaeota archaeon]